MAATTGSTGWLRGRVKAVPSGDSLVIMGNIKAEIPPEKTITLSSLMAPRLARRGGVDEPFAWDSREYLRNLCIGREVTFKVDYTVPAIGREFGTVFLADNNVAKLVVSAGWAKVREPGKQGGEVSPYLSELLQLELQAKEQSLGRWSEVPGAAEQSVRDLPPSAVGDPTNIDAMGLLAKNKGKPMEAIVEHVRDGSTLRVYLLPDFQFVQVFVAGAQSPSAGRRGTMVAEPAPIASETNGDSSPPDTSAPLTSAQRLATSFAPNTEVPADRFGREAKHFTEFRVLNRDVRIVLEGVDGKGNLVGSVFYPEGDTAKDLGLELIQDGYAKYVEWSASMMDDEAKRRLKSAELQAKKDRIRMWDNYVAPISNSKAITNQNFTGKVVEVVSGDCIIVADDSVPFGSPNAERRVNLSSIRSPKVGNPKSGQKPDKYGREAKEFLRTRLIGRQVSVFMEYSRKLTPTDSLTGPSAPTDSRVLDFGSVFLTSPSKADTDDTQTQAQTQTQTPGVNVGEMVISRGFGSVIKHRDFEERSNYYDALLVAESRALAAKKGVHSTKEPPVMHITDLTTGSAKKAKDFLPFLQKSRRLPAVVEYVLSGHRFKLLIPKETCSIAFALSGVRCPGRNEPYSEEAISLMRRKILQRDVEIEVETVDRTGTFLGTIWESKTNVGISLLEAGLAKLQSFGADRIQDIHLLAQAEQIAKRQKLKIWENYVEGQEETNGSRGHAETKDKEVLKVVVTEVLGGGKFYVQLAGDQKVSSIQNQLASLSIREAPVLGAFNPNKGDLVLAQFSLDNSWNRAMIVNGPRTVSSLSDKFEVFYIDYGNQETVPYSHLRPIDASVGPAVPGLAQLCSLAYIKVPDLSEDFGEEAAAYLSECTLNASKEFRAMVEEKDTSGGKTKGQGTGTVLFLTLVDVEAGSSINAAMLQEGLAKMERRKKWDSRERKTALDQLDEFQEKAKKERLGIWQYGDVQSDDDEAGPPARKPAGSRR